jgi:hypothetical protein
MTRFPTAGDLASWTGVCPGAHESAGKRRRVSTTPGNQWLRRALIEAARAAVRTKGSYFGAQYPQIARRRGPNKAAVAVAHTLIELVWHLLSTGEVFNDLGDDYFTNRQDPERRARRLVAQLEQLGYAATLEATPVSPHNRRPAAPVLTSAWPRVALARAQSRSQWGISPQIEHRLFSYIARNWRGKPLVLRQAIVSLIGATTSTAGLKVYAQLDEHVYERAIKVPDAQLATVNLTRDEFHGEWNYLIKPST